MLHGILSNACGLKITEDNFDCILNNQKSIPSNIRNILKDKTKDVLTMHRVYQCLQNEKTVNFSNYFGS